MSYRLVEFNRDNISLDLDDVPSSRSRSIVVLNKRNGKQYRIVKQLGKGGYGTVFLCYDHKNRIRALKTERDPALNQEIQILNEARRKKCVHIIKMYDHGTCTSLDEPFILMTCLGRNLSDMKKRLPNKMYTKSTVYRILMQTLTAVHELHSLGYVSRDIKPSNFCVGRPNIAPRSIFIIDFGVARDFRNDNEQTVINEFSATAFKGTVKYCPIANHLFKKQCRRDDMESWFYMAYEFFEGKLPWHRISRKARHRIKDIKTILRTPTPKMFSQSPKFMHELLLKIDGIKFLEKPNYCYIHQLLVTAFNEAGYKFDEEYDWERYQKEEPSNDNKVLEEISSDNSIDKK
uniref:Protein kinase domain-containing protein n=1 Tax=Parastrongyloides trichosuri TaxID=131310 RepID=A0A0N4Z9C1_PARTI